MRGGNPSIHNCCGNAAAEYTYDAWGNPLSITGTLASTIGQLNPFRYRGYVWDSETGLFYVNSRYYNPTWGRWINGDSQLNPDAFGSNQFVYCGNNLVNRVDLTGHDWEEIKDAFLRAAEKYREHVSRSYDIEDINFFLPPVLSFQSSEHITNASISIASTIGVKSLIKNSTSLSKTASTLSGNLQNESDDLIKQFRNGNKNPGIGTKHLVDDIYYLRGKKGARVFYRMKNGTMEILGKATKGNADDVIKLVTKLFKKVT